MKITRSMTQRFVRTIIVGTIVLTIVGYATWRSLNYFRGPEITIFEPKNGSSVATSTIIIRGQVQRINNIALNGSPIFIDEQGNFGRILAVFKGLNILTFDASDQFGRTTKLELRLLGTVDLPTPPSARPTGVVTATTSVE